RAHHLCQPHELRVVDLTVEGTGLCPQDRVTGFDDVSDAAICLGGGEDGADLGGDCRCGGHGFGPQSARATMSSACLSSGASIILPTEANAPFSVLERSSTGGTQRSTPSQRRN